LRQDETVLTTIEVPTLVRQAEDLARSTGFPLTPNQAGPSCCLPHVGRLLAVLAAGSSRIGEIGTGVGYGAAWMASAMPEGATLTTVELDQGRAALAAELFERLEAVQVLAGDGPSMLAGGPPLDLLFVDGGPYSRSPESFDPLIDLVAVGGRLVVDDVTPINVLPPDSPLRDDDPKRAAVLGSRRLWATEVVCPDLRHSALVATRVR
jgi:predicted O-methyltransferase YrrM